MLVFSFFFVFREILHTSHVKSHIGSNRKKGNQRGCNHFSTIFQKNVTNMLHNNMGAWNLSSFSRTPKSPGMSSLHHMADEASLEGSGGNEKSSVDTLVKLGA